MRTRAILVLIAIVGATTVLAVNSSALHAQSTTAVALTGVISSAEEGPMEGVIVSAKAADATITTSVVTDERGRYTFPASRLAPGHYGLTIRAAGYDLSAPAGADVAAQRSASADLKLRKTREVAFQLTDGEWVASMPGTDEQKRALLDCNSCHSLQRVVFSSWSAKEFTSIIPRMATYVNNSTPVRPQKRYAMPPGSGMNPKALENLANYLETVNLHNRSYWSYEPKAFPRPKGRATHVIFTEYDLPRPTIEPHDVFVQNGIAWYSDFGEEYLGRLDTKTGKVTEYPVPELKKGYPQGHLDLQPDKAGNLWLSGMYQAGVTAFNTKTEAFKAYPLPAEMNGTTAQQSMVMPNNMDVDGKVWTNNQDRHQVLKLDAATGKYEALGPFKDTTGRDRTISGYGIISDSQNNAYLLDMGGEGQSIVKIDAKTGAMTMYPTPTARSMARRGRVFGNDQIVFAEYGANQIGTFDPKTGQFKEYKMPPQSNPYDAFADKNGNLWTGSMWNDRIVRVDPKTNQSVAYLLPHFTNIRRVFVDDTTTPVTFWTSDNHGASIVKLEPND
jgi:virginiamycin B lyase